MSIRRYLRDLIYFISGATLLFLIVILFKLRKDISQHGLNSIPANNFSNSLCLNAKLQHLHDLKIKEKIEFLVIGSSMALNNISAKRIQSELQVNTYNLASWGQKPDLTYQIIKEIEFPQCKTVLLAFNNHDFGSNEFNVKNFKLINQYLDVNSSTLNNWKSFLYNFNFQDFRVSWTKRSQYLYSSNIYESLNFDQCGSALLDRNQFVTRPKRDYYEDTVGFSQFMVNVANMRQHLSAKNIKLILVYLPWREDLRTPQRVKENNDVARVLRSHFKKDFIDLHNDTPDRSLFCDSGHLFDLGAEGITKQIIDSFQTADRFYAFK